MFGGYDNMEQAAPFTGVQTWHALTGKGATDFDTDGKTDTAILQDITNARGQGKQVLVLTYDTLPGNLPASLQHLAADHFYVVTGYTRDENNGIIEVQLYNPWGYPHVDVPYEWLSEVLYNVCALDRLNP